MTSNGDANNEDAVQSVRATMFFGVFLSSRINKRIGRKWASSAPPKLVRVFQTTINQIKMIPARSHLISRSLIIIISDGEMKCRGTIVGTKAIHTRIVSILIKVVLRVRPD